MGKGNFVISLDFEINWGVRDVVEFDRYKDHLVGVREVIPGLLKLFGEYNIQVTFATVGFLFFETKEQLMAGLPSQVPKYKDKRISPYEGHFDLIRKDEKEDVFHFAPSLIKQIVTAGQEVGCHTFSHYYCLEEGQTIDDFREDLKAAKRVAEKNGIILRSFVFPRNQYNEEYLKVCKEEGITAYRGNEKSWIYSAKTYKSETLFRRVFRLIDAYINISGHNCSKVVAQKDGGPCDIPSSRFLRPYSKRTAFMDWLRSRRIKGGMTYAAKHGLTYHIWWHPHNFGKDLVKNLFFLERILQHYHKLSDKYGFRNINMQQLADEINKAQ